RARRPVVEHAADRHAVTLDELEALLEAQPATPQHADDMGVAGELLVGLDPVGDLLAGVALDQLDLAATDPAGGVDLLHRRVQRVVRDLADEGPEAREGRDHADLDRVAAGHLGTAGRTHATPA